MNDVVHSHSISAAMNSDPEILRMYQHNSHRQTSYYMRKWGGMQGSEKYKTPFNNPYLGIHDWSVTEGFWHPHHPNRKNWNPPQPSVRY